MRYHWVTCFMLLVGPIGLSAGCEEFVTPAELDKPQILAIRAEPPALLPAENSTLSILVAGPEGIISDPDVTWASVSTNPGEPPLGTVMVGDDEEVIYTAPATIAESVVYGSVTARIASADGDLAALKVMTIGDESVSNPTLVTFTSDGSDLLDDRTLLLTTGQTAALALDIDTTMDDTTSVAWYTTIGIIERYQSNPADFMAGDEPGTGWLIAVVRDGSGGIAWEVIEVTVE